MHAFFLLALAACGAGAPESTEPPAPAPVPDAPAPAREEAPSEAEVLVAGTVAAPADLPDAQAVFVSLRVPGRRGPPLAAKKLPPGPFPLSFTLTPADRPMARGAVPDAFDVKITLDVDGNPMSKSPEDLEAVVSGTRGQRDLSATLAPRQ